MMLCDLDNINMAAHSEISQIDGIAFGKHFVLHSPWSPPPTLRVSSSLSFLRLWPDQYCRLSRLGSLLFSPCCSFLPASYLFSRVTISFACLDLAKRCGYSCALLREPVPFLALGFLDRCMVTNNLAHKILHLILGFGIRRTLKRTYYRCTRQFSVIVVQCKRQAHLP